MNANPNAVAQFTPAARDTDEAGRWRLVRVRDLVLPVSIGIYDYEKLAPQRVCINVELKVREGGGPIGDDIANVLSYEDIVNGIKAIVADGHINLVETLAERIAEFCLADARVARARVGVDKLDIVPEAASVGVEIERSR
ncbi:MAG: dihydroneopterin aldolase [Alphaproteobacteria bacterium]|nr:dihydroneopterin aldolase [Alphaproteobacteria bacterium]